MSCARTASNSPIPISFSFRHARLRKLRLCYFVLVLFGLVSSLQGQAIVTTIAGTDWLFPGDGGKAINAPLGGGYGPDIALDPQGNLYICDPGNLMVMRVGSDGIITVVAGNGLPSWGGDGGPAVNASFAWPAAVAVDSQGNFFIADRGSTGYIRKVTPDGIIRTIAGDVTDGPLGNGGLANEAGIGIISGLAVDATGTIYFSDATNLQIRKITPDGVIHVVAGKGEWGRGGDGGPATAAQLLGPTRLTVDPKGNIYFVDTAITEQGEVGLVRKIDTNGVIQTIAGGGTSAGDGIAATKSSLRALAVAVDSSGNVFIADVQTFSVRKVNAAGIVSTVAGSGVAGFSGDGGPGLKARFGFGSVPALALDKQGNLYVADDGNARVRKLDPAGLITTVAGNGLFRNAGNGGPAISASLFTPSRLAQDQAGNIYFSESAYHRIRRIAPDKTITMFAGGASSGYDGDGGPATKALLNNPRGLAIAQDGSLLVADTFNCVVRRIDKAGVITTLAGNGTCGYAGDNGPPLKASLNGPDGIAVDKNGDVAITESWGNRIRLISNGNIQTVAGNGTLGYSGDGEDPLKAQLASPAGIRFWNGALYFCDTINNVIRQVTLTGQRTITTVVGNGDANFSGDDGRAIDASLNTPLDLTFDREGNLYIADAYNTRIRIVGLDGRISTFAGGGYYPDDGVSPEDALIGPFSVLQNNDGDIMFGDASFYRVRVVLQKFPTFTASPQSIKLLAQAGSISSDQSIALTGSIPGVLFALTAYQPFASPFGVMRIPSPWLTVSPTDGSMPTRLTVSADASSLTPGAYEGTIKLYALAEPFESIIPVSLTVASPDQPTMTLSPSSLQFSYLVGATAVPRPISVSNAGGGSLPLTITVATDSGGNWLSAGTGPTGVAPAVTLGAFSAAIVQITANPGKLGPGIYSGTVNLVSSELNQRLTVPVTMTVTSVLQTIVIPQTSLAFYSVEGAAYNSVLPQFFSILNGGRGQMPWRVSATTVSGGYWLNVFPATGVTDASQPLVPQVRVDMDPTALAAGTYYGTIQIDAPGAANSPQVVSVQLSVLPPGSNIGPVVQPSGLIFTDVVGGEAPAAQTVQIQNTTGAPLNFTALDVLRNKNVLFNSVPNTGVVSPAQPFRLLLQPVTKGLAAGVYTENVLLSFSDGSTRSVAVVLVLTSPVSPKTSTPLTRQTSSILHPRGGDVSCRPSKLVLVSTLLSNGQVIPAGWPAQVFVKAVDDCGLAMTTGGVTATFTNGDPPLRLISLKDGSWAGTWMSRRVQAKVDVSMVGTVPEQNLSGRTSVSLGLQGSVSSPAIDGGGVVNAASSNAQVLAPGSMITLLGSRLADAPAQTTATPLPYTLAGANILIGGKSTPLLYASEGQLNAVIPYGIPANTTVQVLASRGSSLSAPQSIVIAAAAPGIFTTDGVQAIAVDQNNQILRPGNGAKAGDKIVIYCTGLGEVAPTVVAGQPPSPTTPSTTIVPVSVTIGGVTSPVDFSGLGSTLTAWPGSIDHPFGIPVAFAGLTPSAIGVYQVTTVIPPGVTPGDSVPVVVSAAGQASAPATIAISQ